MGLFESVFFDFAVERAFGDIEFESCGAATAAVAFKREADGLAFGLLADNLGWNSVFEVSIAFGVIGIIILALIWKAPADGYKKADSILAELKAEYNVGR